MPQKLVQSFLAVLGTLSCGILGMNSVQASPNPLFNPPRSSDSTIQSAPPQVNFQCLRSRKNNLPTTYAVVGSGQNAEYRAIIHWQSEYFTGSNYTPETRCQQVTGRFSKYYAPDLLSYLNVGRRNGYQGICITRDPESGNDCPALLITLQRNDDVKSVFTHFKDIVSKQGGQGALYRGSYVSLDQLIQNLEPDSETPMPLQ